MFLKNLFQRVSNSQMQELCYLTFYYSTGTALNASVNYVLKCGEGKPSVIIIPDGVSEEQALMTGVEDAFAERILGLLHTYRVGSWNGFDRTDKRILDGSSFTLNAGFQSGKSIHAHDYMRFPPRYREFREAMDHAFMEVYRQFRV